VLAANGEPPLVRRKDLESERAVVTPAGGGGARLLMIEFVVPPGDTPHLSKMSDLNMLAMLTARNAPKPNGVNSSQPQASPASKYTRPAHHCHHPGNSAIASSTRTDQPFWRAKQRGR
jgi:hypothetical protein